MKCQWTGKAAGSKCERCGYVLTRDYPRGLVRNCPIPGLGDRVAKVLAAVGIRKWKGCKCSQRQSRLNSLGRTVGQWWRG
jgi:hypothetical protein